MQMIEYLVTNPLHNRIDNAIKESLIEDLETSILLFEKLRG